MDTYIFIADQESGVLEQVRGALSSLYSIDSFHSSGVLIRAFHVAAAQGKHVPVCICDTALKRPGGLQVVRALREAVPGVAVIFTVGQVPPPSEGDLKKDGGRIGVLKKPFSSEELVGLVRKLLLQEEKLSGETMLGEKLFHFQYFNDNVFRIRRNAEGNFILVFNEGTIPERFGITTQKTGGKALEEVIGEKRTARVIPYLERAYAGEVVSYEMELGATSMISMIVPVFQDGVVVEVVGSSLEVTERKRAQETQDRARRLAEALQQASLILNSTLDYKQTIQAILQQAVRVLTFDYACVMELKGHELFLMGTMPPGDRDSKGEEYIPLTDESPHKEVIEGRKIVVRHDLPVEITAFKKFTQGKIFSWMGIPMIVKEKVIGMLTMGRKSEGYFSEEEQQVATAFTAHVTVALENARSYTEAQRRITEMSVLNEIIQSVSSRLEMAEYLKLVSKQVNRFLGSPQMLIVSYEEASDEWEVLFTQEDLETLPGLRHNTHEGLIGYVIQTRTPLFIENSRQLDEFIRRTGRVSLGKVPKCWMGVPLILADRVVGALAVQDINRENCFNLDDLRLFTTIGSQVAISLENARLFARMEQLAITDSVTGVFNRRHFMFQATKEFDRAVRYHKSLGLVMIDIDNFKQVNDTYGHLIGDEVLQSLAANCSETLRKVDMMGRYGGEEFTILLPETGQENAYKVAERLRKIIASGVILTAKGEVHITVSLGLAMLEDKHRRLEDLIGCADMALYEAKQAGKNRVKLYVDPNLR